MGRRLRSILPLVPDKLAPVGQYNPDFQVKERRYRDNMASSYNRRSLVKLTPAESAAADLPEPGPSLPAEQQAEQPTTPVVTRSGRLSKKPVRLNYS